MTRDKRIEELKQQIAALEEEARQEDQATLGDVMRKLKEIERKLDEVQRPIVIAPTVVPQPDPYRWGRWRDVHPWPYITCSTGFASSADLKVESVQ